jgi:hypothetical protein
LFDTLVTGKKVAGTNEIFEIIGFAASLKGEALNFWFVDCAEVNDFT